jgi:hypothetical protein
LHTVIRTPGARAAGLALGLLAMGVPAASAQETRAEAIAQQKARKAQQLAPYVPSKVEEIFTRFTRGFVAVPAGWFPAIGSVHGGGGFTAGAGYRRFVSDKTFVEARGLYSIKQYKLGGLALVSPALFGGRGALRVDGFWRDATQIGYYGLGMATSDADRANYRMQQTFVGTQLDVRPAGPLVLGAAASFEGYAMKSGEGRHPTIEERYTPADAPGLGESPDYVHLTALGGIDWRPAAGYARRGGLYQLTYHAFRDTDSAFDFSRVDAEVVQHLPILRETWVLSFRGRVQSTVGDTDVVPYYMLPSLGGGSTLRGYSTSRLRDRHALLLQGEWRWIPNRSGLDMAIFYDMGKVADRRGDLDLRGLKSNVGIGVRFHGLATTPLRIELARGNEGLNLVFSGRAIF